MGDTFGAVGMLERGAFMEQFDGLLGEAGLGRGRLVLVRGEAGIGKSTLVDAFVSGRGSRVLWGTCDPVVPPVPLAPVLDMAERRGGELRTALADGDRHRVFAAFLGLLRAEPGPWIAVFEDMQWADEATLELLRVVGRRVAGLAAVVVVTFRDDEVGADHPLSGALGDIPAASMLALRLPALSVAAVRELADGVPIDVEALHRAAAGNPFFVTEVLAAGGGELPETVRDAVWARVRRLSSDALQVMRAASVLGQRCDVPILLAVAAVAPNHLDECVRRGLLKREGSLIEFRHELAQRAVLDSVPPAERAVLHANALSALPPSTRAAELAHHAVQAGDGDVVLRFAPQAGAEAIALGAFRAARTHAEHAVQYAERLDPPERAALLAQHARACYLSGDGEQAIVSQRQSVGLWHRLGDALAEGRSLSDLAEYLMWDGQGETARATAAEAVELLETLPPSTNLARAYARLAQLLMVGGHHAEALPWGNRAVELGERLGEEAVVVHALNTVGSAEVSMGLDNDMAKLQESLRRARQAGLHDDIARALNNLIGSAAESRQYGIVERYLPEVASLVAEREVDLALLCLSGDVAESLLEMGRWEEAAAQALEVIDRDTVHGRMQCAMVLGLIAARRGEPGALRWLDEAAGMLDAGIYGRDSQIWSARAEAAWLAGDRSGAVSEVRQALATHLDHSRPWMTGLVAFWAWKLGVEWDDRPARLPEPYAFQLSGHPAKAAAAWAELGCPYQEAVALLDSDQQTDVRRALETFLALGASSAATIATQRLRDMGATRIPRGHRATTRANPVGLSNREVEVLVLLADGLRNAEIAERLVVSTKTVDHHVSAILSKLGVRSRHEARRRAAELGLGAR